MLEVLELPELIAKDGDDYVAISCRLLVMRASTSRCATASASASRVTRGARAFQLAVETICRQAPTVGQQPGCRPMPDPQLIPA